MATADPELDGTYVIWANVNDNQVEAMAELVTSGTTLTGKVSAKGVTAQIEDGVATDEGFSFSAKVKVAIMTISGSVSGKRDGDSVSGEITSKFGNFTFVGERVV